jgi:outer membrane protein OmpA-like peptidoglycan-associated protein
MGTANPVASNETAQGRAENRRVTVRLGVNRGIGE